MAQNVLNFIQKVIILSTLKNELKGEGEKSLNLGT